MIAGNKDYRIFGTHILEDDKGNLFNIISSRNRDDPESTVTEILTEWLAGKGKKPPTWSTLVECLRTSKLTALADQIEGQYKILS